MATIRQACAGLAILCLSACATNRFSADVVRFHSGFQTPAGSTVAIRPVDPGLAGSLEFAGYANQLGERLGRLGFKPAPGGPSDFVAELAYSQQTRDSSVDSGGRSPVNIGIGVGGGSGNFGLGGSVNFPLGNRQQQARGVRDTLVTLRLKRGDATVWEGRATAESASLESNSLPLLMPDLIDALLSNFPGESGKTVRYSPPAKK